MIITRIAVSNATEGKAQYIKRMRMEDIAMKQTEANKKLRQIVSSAIILGVLYCVLRRAMAKKTEVWEGPAKEGKKEPDDFRLRYLEE